MSQSRAVEGETNAGRVMCVAGYDTHLRPSASHSPLTSDETAHGAHAAGDVFQP